MALSSVLAWIQDATSGLQVEGPEANSGLVTNKHVCMKARKHARVHACIDIHSCMYTCIHLCVCANAYTHANKQKGMHTYATYVHEYIYAYIPAYAQALVHTCMHAYMHTCIRAHMHTCMHAFMRAYIHDTYIHVCVKALVRTCMHACMHACMHGFVHTYMHTCRPAHAHAFFVGLREVLGLGEVGNKDEPGERPELALFVRTPARSLMGVLCGAGCGRLGSSCQSLFVRVLNEGEHVRIFAAGKRFVVYRANPFARP